jgi:hypothetical protein
MYLPPPPLGGTPCRKDMATGDRTLTAYFGEVSFLVNPSVMSVSMKSLSLFDLATVHTFEIRICI